MTTKPETITHDSLAAALAAFQGEVPVITKDKVNPHFKSKYADLASISATIMPILAKHGLSFTCTPRQLEDGWAIFGTLMHTSGNAVEGFLPIMGTKMQEFGSSITYARRYLLGALTGVVTDEDDDGNAASQSTARLGAPTGLTKSQIDMITSYQARGVNVHAVFEDVLGRKATARDMTTAEGHRVINHLADAFPESE